MQANATPKGGTIEQKAEMLDLLMEGNGKYSFCYAGTASGYCLMYKDAFKLTLLKSGATLPECLEALRAEIDQIKALATTEAAK